MKVLFISLGCDKNLVDSEVMLGLLSRHGYEFTDDEEEAEAVVINTCCFISDAKEESVNTILDMAERRKNGQLQALLVTGCLAQRYSEEMQVEIPEVDAVLGTTAIDAIADALDEVLRGQQHNYIEDINKAPQGGRHRVVTTGGYYAYLKIAEGCDKHCTYCIIPKVRGDYRSVPMEQLLKEAKELAEGGVRELILVAQETTLYGKDLYGEKSLPRLLRELCKIEGIHWIRLLYCYPEEITDELIGVIKEEEKICHYLDIPVQSGCDETLKRMNRKYTTEEYETALNVLRTYYEHPALTTDVIAGFVGETEEEFEKTRAYLEKINLYEMHIFKYSVREGTRAQKMSGHVPEQVKTERSDVLLAMAKRHKSEFEKWYVGRKEKVLLEEIIEKNGKKYFQGYTAHYVKVAVELSENDTKLRQNEIIVVDIQGFIDENLLYGKVSIEF